MYSASSGGVIINIGRYSNFWKLPAAVDFM